MIKTMLTQAADGLTWTAAISGIDGMPVVSAEGATAADAGTEARRLALPIAVATAKAAGLTVGPAELATLELRLRQSVSLAVLQLSTPEAPPAALPFGEDIKTFPDLDPYLRGVSRYRAVAEAVARRLLTPRGLLPHALDEGTDVAQLLDADLSPRELARYESLLAAEAEGDERVRSASVKLSLDEKEHLHIRVRVDTNDGPFVLVLLVTKLTADLSVLEA